MSNSLQASPDPRTLVPLNQVKSVSELFRNREFQQAIAEALVPGIAPQRFVKTCALAWSSTPKLGQCRVSSVLGAFITCATLGLEPNSFLGQAYLIPIDRYRWDPAQRRRVPIGTDLQVIIGYRGYLALMRRSGKLSAIRADVVWKHDDFSYEYGSNAHFRHRRSSHPREPGEEPIFAYIYAREGDHEIYEVLSRDDIHAHRAHSKAYQLALTAAEECRRQGKAPETDKRYSECPWIRNPVEMWKKTMFRSVANYWPFLVEMVTAARIDERSVNFDAIQSAGHVLEGDFAVSDDHYDPDILPASGTPLAAGQERESPGAPTLPSADPPSAEPVSSRPDYPMDGLEQPEAPRADAAPPPRKGSARGDSREGEAISPSPVPSAPPPVARPALPMRPTAAAIDPEPAHQVASEESNAKEWVVFDGTGDACFDGTTDLSTAAENLISLLRSADYFEAAQAIMDANDVLVQELRATDTELAMRVANTLMEVPDGEEPPPIDVPLRRDRTPNWQVLSKTLRPRVQSATKRDLAKIVDTLTAVVPEKAPEALGLLIQELAQRCGELNVVLPAKLRPLEDALTQRVNAELARLDGMDRAAIEAWSKSASVATLIGEAQGSNRFDLVQKMRTAYSDALQRQRQTDTLI